jgi:hypothetical protein
MKFIYDEVSANIFRNLSERLNKSFAGVKNSARAVPMLCSKWFFVLANVFIEGCRRGIWNDQPREMPFWWLGFAGVRARSNHTKTIIHNFLD